MFNSMPQFENFMTAIKQLAISDTEKDTEKKLQQIEKDFPSQAVGYFKTQWWDDRERWMELHVRKHVNFGISTTSRVEGTHAALKAVLTSSSGTLFTAGNKITRQGLLQARRNSVIGSNENVIVKTIVREQVETAALCTKISRSALDLIHAEVMKSSMIKKKTDPRSTVTAILTGDIFFLAPTTSEWACQSMYKIFILVGESNRRMSNWISPLYISIPPRWPYCKTLL
ncbi:hypothetical protein V1506DRAFT_548466 [Lipomyces tetrasporus]